MQRQNDCVKQFACVTFFFLQVKLETEEMSQKELLIVNSVENVSLYHAITGSRISNQKCPPGKIGVCYCKKRNLLIRKENKKTVIKILKPFKVSLFILVLE